MTELDESRLKQEIKGLAKAKQLAFGLLLCERMIPALDKFSIETNFDSSLYTYCLDKAWHYLGQREDSYNCGEMAKQCLDRAPDTEEFSHPLTSAALNAALSIAAMIGFVGDGDITHVVEAASLACDTAALYAQSIETTPPGSLSFNEIMKHPLVQRELGQQAADLVFLAALPADVSQRTIQLLKGRATGTPALLPPENGVTTMT